MKSICLVLLLGLLFSFTSTKAVDLGDIAPDFELTSPDGQAIRLSSLKGKMVLIDFWASWCRPCRMENPNVVEAYKKYSNQKFKEGKGFEVFSVSLDRNKEAWVQAIDKDKLTWKSHVWDNEGKVSTIYGVKFIPTAFLVNGKGKIVARGEGIRGLGLHTTLDDLLK
ncbi:MAG: TlpA family protein disulfide reductase [Bacteroidetes bacterium]|nr:TlpA family protein disulfide reductase [Bacteroidota bacterium]